MKRALVFDPYWDTLGGGERYVATIAAAYFKSKYQPIIAWNDDLLLEKIKKRFGLNLEGAVVDKELYKLLLSSRLNTTMKLTSEFDSVFWVSDGSIPFLGSKNNILHFQVPFTRKISLLNRIKINNFDSIVCNSQFTKSIIDKNYGCSCSVLYPPVPPMPRGKKENLILSVGRFDNILHSKRQDVLINAFKELNRVGWKLILAGGSIDTNGKVDSLKKFIGDYPIEIIVNPGFSQIQDLYSRAKLYWHAAGFGSDLKSHPEKAEHFGIVTVEAMSARVIPLVFAGGGQLEIVLEGRNGYLWQTVEELVAKTQNVIDNKVKHELIADQAAETAKKFSQERFMYEFSKFIS